jgi:hypothetical protein
MVTITAEMSLSVLTVWEIQPKKDKLNAGNRCVVKEEQREEQREGTTMEYISKIRYKTNSVIGGFLTK